MLKGESKRVLSAIEYRSR